MNKEENLIFNLFIKGFQCVFSAFGGAEKNELIYMAFEKRQQFERPDKNREKLLALEKEGTYVFHGSPNIIEILEPRQAAGHNEETDEWEEDGTPAVFASPYADCAIFRALIYGEDLDNEMGINGDQLHFIADKELIARAKGKVGKVYVLDKSKFEPNSFRGMDCRSEEKIVPLDVVEVTIKDLPENIEIINNN
ncbi:MAG: hypothetical protein WA055_01045 [Candidatus Moraniibacteriota bacterium]